MCDFFCSFFVVSIILQLLLTRIFARDGIRMCVSFVERVLWCVLRENPYRSLFVYVVACVCCLLTVASYRSSNATTFRCAVYFAYILVIFRTSDMSDGVDWSKTYLQKFCVWYLKNHIVCGLVFVGEGAYIVYHIAFYRKTSCWSSW